MGGTQGLDSLNDPAWTADLSEPEIMAIVDELDPEDAYR